MASRAAFLAALPLAGSMGLSAAAQTPATLRVGANPNDPYAEGYYAQDGGFFSKAGLAVDIQTFPNGGPIVAAVASGSLDIGLSNPPQLATAIEHGVPFVFFAGSALYLASAPTSALCVSSASGMNGIKDFAGKTIAVSSLKDGTYLAAVAYLGKGGVDTGRVKFVEIPFGEMGPAVERGTVDAAVMVEPALTLAVDAGKTRIFARPFDAIGDRFLATGWFTTSEWYGKNAALAKRFAAAIYQTARWANTNHDATAEILQNHSKISGGVVKKMVRCAYAESLNARMLDPILSVAARLKVTSRVVSSAEMIAKP